MSSQDSILVVEDEVFVAEKIQRMLEKNGFDVVDTASSGDDAVSILRDHSVDLVLMDIELSGEKDGIETTRAINENHQAPVVYLTAYTDSEYLERAKETNPFGYLSKPIDKDDLTSTIEMALKKDRQVRSERQDFKDELKLSRQRYHKLVHAMSDIVYQIDAEGNFKFVSASASDLGYSLEGLEGEHFTKIIHPADRPYVSRKEVLPAFQSKETGPDEAPDLFDERRTGERSSRMEVRILTGPEYEKDHEFRYFEVSSTGFYQSGETEHFLGSIGVMRDITDRKQAQSQIQSMNDQLKRANRELQRFADVATHDLKQPLRTIASYAELVEDRYGTDLDQDALDYIDKVVIGVRNMKDLLDGLRNYTGVNTEETTPEELSLSDTVDATEANLKKLIDENQASIAVKSDMEITCYPELLQQFFQNVLKNSLQHGGDSVTIEVEPLDKGDFWIIEVRDDGPGIESQYTDKIFDIFHSLEQEAGSDHGGLGLAIAQKIARLHQGEVWAESPDNEGMTIKLRIPKQLDQGGTVLVD